MIPLLDELDLLDHPYNTTALNERAWEVPMALSWLRGRVGPGIEIGNVLGHYVDERPTRRIVDRYEEAPGVENVDVFDVRGSYRWVLAISTIEHVRWDPPEQRHPNVAELAAMHLLRMVAPGGAMLATVPFGQHPHLDRAIERRGLGATNEATVVRELDGGWSMRHGERVRLPLRERSWPSSVWVGEWIR